MQLQISARSHVGKVRKKNEDNFCVLDMILPEEKTENYQWSIRTRIKRPVFLGVFDGMGGYSKGERASFLMARIACRMAGEMGDVSASQLLTDICMTSNLAVCQEMRGPEGCQMGTTAAMLPEKHPRTESYRSSRMPCVLQPVTDSACKKMS